MALSGVDGVGGGMALALGEPHGHHLSGRCWQQAVRRRACTSRALALLHGYSPLNSPVGVKSWIAGRVKGMPPCKASMQQVSYAAA